MKGASNRKQQEHDAHHRPRTVEPPGWLPRIDPAPPAVAGDAGQLVPERVVRSSGVRGFILTGSLAGLVALGIVGFGFGGTIPFDST